MTVLCGICGTPTSESVCRACGAALCTDKGNWYWSRPKTGIEKHFEMLDNIRLTGNLSSLISNKESLRFL
jgi:hypothetical protein